MDEEELRKIEERKIKLSKIDDSSGNLPKIIGISEKSFIAIGVKMTEKYSNYVELARSFGLDTKQVISLVEQEISDKGVEFSVSMAAIRIWNEKGKEEITVKKFVATIMLVRKISMSYSGRMALIVSQFPGFRRSAA